MMVKTIVSGIDFSCLKSVLGHKLSLGHRENDNACLFTSLSVKWR